MQLKFRRSMGAEGVFSKAKFVLDAVALPTAEERALLTAHRGLTESIWHNADDKRRDTGDGDEVWKKLTGTDLQKLLQGGRFEYLDFNSVLRTETNIMDACQNILGRCRTLASFDGSERVVELTEDDAAEVARG